MANKKQSKIHLHPQSEDVKQYIYSERFEGVGFRLIAKGLADLFDIKISHTGVANWLSLNPAPTKLEANEEQPLILDIFDFELFEELLPENPTEIEKIKTKYYTLIQCNIDRHISTGKRLNNDYVKHLKTVLEVARLEAQVQREVQSIENESKELQIEILTKHQKPNFDNLSTKELKQLKALMSKVEYKDQYEPYEKHEAIKQHIIK